MLQSNHYITPVVLAYLPGIPVILHEAIVGMAFAGVLADM